MLESGRLSRDNPACLLYLVSESVDDRNVVWVQDLWTSREEHEAFMKVLELGRFIAQARLLLEGCPSKSKSARTPSTRNQADLTADL